MPWKECSVMDERLRFVARLLDGEAMSEVCRAFGISRKTGYKIFDHIWQQSGADKKGKGRRGARFAPDSPLEGTGFEPSVPREGPDTSCAGSLSLRLFPPRGRQGKVGFGLTFSGNQPFCRRKTQRHHRRSRP